MNYSTRYFSRIFTCDGYIFFKKKTPKKAGEWIPDREGQLEIGRLLTKSGAITCLRLIVNFRDFDKWVILMAHSLIAKLNAVKPWCWDIKWQHGNVACIIVNNVNFFAIFFRSPQLSSGWAFVIPWMSVVRRVSTISILFFSESTGQIILIFGKNSL